ncbi:MAG: hypothetical protein IPI76_00160 [Chloracidobacterium sp.]|nr:hypothetical protein [Chloracidobacterium sp.]
MQLDKFPENIIKTESKNEQVQALNASFFVDVPEGFAPSQYKLSYNGAYGVKVTGAHPLNDDYFEIALNDFTIYYYTYLLAFGLEGKPDRVGKISSDFYNDNRIECKVIGHDIYTYNFNLELTFVPTKEKIDKWQKGQYEKIINKYKEKLDEYYKGLAEYLDNKVASSNDKKLDFRNIENLCIRKQCLTYLINDSQLNRTRQMGLVDLFIDRTSIETLAVRMDKRLDEYTALRDSSSRHLSGI